MEKDKVAKKRERSVAEIHADGTMTMMTRKQERAWWKKNKTVIRDKEGEYGGKG